MSLAGEACKGNGATPSRLTAPYEALDTALRPAALVAKLRGLRGAHLKGQARFHVRPAAPPGANQVPAAPDSVTTDTELWLDAQGQFRLVESNDQDGGREVVLVGRELAIALRYGRMIRRPAQEPEPTRLLEEAASAPWAAWETVRRFATVTPSGPGAYKIGKADQAQAASADEPALRRWRDSVEVQSLTGEARFDEQSGALVSFSLESVFSAKREGVLLAGETSVKAQLDGIGSTTTIAPPASEELRKRQRTVLDERALLGKDLR